MNIAARLTTLPLFAFLLVGCAGEPEDFGELTIADLQDGMQRGEVRAEALVNWYIERYERYDRPDGGLASIIEINPDALTIARALDEERQSSGPRGPLHGIPILLKANIDTADDMATSAGSLALDGHRAGKDAFLAQRLRDAGAILLGKTNLSEWANFRSTRSTSGWSGVGGQTRNPYDLSRSPCGSSSGSGAAVAANLAVAAVGTETNGSIVCPAGVNGIVGIKPTVGLISRSGIIPIAASFDTAGPMARTVRDAAILLEVMTGVDPADAAMNRAMAHSYSAGLAADALQGKRVGIVRGWSGENSNPDVDRVYADAIKAIEEAGGETVDPVRFAVDDMYAAGYEVMLYEFRAGLNAYLETSRAEFATLDEIIAFNNANAARSMPWFGQDILKKSATYGDPSEAGYQEALAASRDVARAAIDAAMDEHDLDALIAPSNGPAWKIDLANGEAGGIGSSSLAAYAGYPNITVPAGYVHGLPVGLSFFGRAYSEKHLIAMAYAFEQATRIRRQPVLTAASE